MVWWAPRVITSVLIGGSEIHTQKIRHVAREESLAQCSHQPRSVGSHQELVSLEPSPQASRLWEHSPTDTMVSTQ